MRLGLTYEDGKRDALWLIWCMIEDMNAKYPMTGQPDQNANYKNGWNDVAHALSMAARRGKK